MTELRDKGVQELRLAIDGFLAGRDPEETVLLYVSCHGVLNARRRLYFAASDTDPDRLASTGLDAPWLIECLDECRARRQIVILDCCFSGAFTTSKGVKGPTDVGLGELFNQPEESRGRAVLTASRATEYSFEGEALSLNGTPGSVFTEALLDGLRTGAADADRDGLVSASEAYSYTYARVRENGRGQNPQHWVYGREGRDLVITRSPAGIIIEPARIPDEIWAGLNSGLPRVRQGAVETLAEWLTDPDPARVAAARAVLSEIAEQDISSVAQVARQYLDHQSPPLIAPGSPTASLPATDAPYPDPDPPPPPGRPGIWSLVAAIGRSVVTPPGLIGAGVALLAAVLVIVLVVPPGHSQGGDPHGTNTIRATGSTRPTPSPTASPPPNDCQSGTLDLLGSAAFGPIAQIAANAYMGHCPQATINVDYKDKSSAWGVTQVENALKAHPNQAGSMIAMFDGTTSTLATGLTPYPAGVIIYSVVAHTGAVPGSNIDVAGLQRLFGQPDGVPNEVAVGLQSGAGSRLAFLTLIHEPEQSPISKHSCVATPGRVFPYPTCTANNYDEALKFISETPNSIGYVAVGGRTVGYPNVSVISIKSVNSINGAAPTPGDVLNGSYSFTAVEHLYLPPQPSKLANDFLAYLQQDLARYQSPDFLGCSSSPSIAAQCAGPR